MTGNIKGWGKTQNSSHWSQFYGNLHLLKKYRGPEVCSLVQMLRKHTFIKWKKILIHYPKCFDTPLINTFIVQVALIQLLICNFSYISLHDQVNFIMGMLTSPRWGWTISTSLCASTQSLRAWGTGYLGTKFGNRRLVSLQVQKSISNKGWLTPLFFW